MRSFQLEIFSILFDHIFMNVKTDNIIDIVFMERVFSYSLLPMAISFSFFSIFMELIREASGYYSPFFYWYPVYFLVILSFSTYTNSAMIHGNRFLRSIFESIAEIIILLAFNFVFLKSSEFETLGKFLDFDFGISFFVWIFLRVINGYLVRITHLPYYIITRYSNAIASNKLEEAFEKGFFEEKENSVRTTRKVLVSTLVIMSFALFLGLVFARKHTITMYVFSFIYFFSVLMFYMNIIKVLFVEESIKMEGQLPIEMLKNWFNTSVKFSLIALVISGILSSGVFWGIYSISKSVNISIRDKINELIARSSKSDEEQIEEIRKKLLSQQSTNVTEYTQSQKLPEKKVLDFWQILVVVSGIVIFFIVIGFFLKEVLKLNVHNNSLLKFFMATYDVFIYIIRSVIFFFLEMIKYLIRSLRRESVSTKEIEEDLIKSMVYGSEDKVSEEKLEEIETIVRLFVKMLNVTNYFLPYRKSMGIQEYCDKLKLYLPEFMKDIEFISEVVNESRYSRHILEPGRVEKFRKSVNEIIDKLSIKVRVVEEFRGY